jgi:hypothetical protein
MGRHIPLAWLLALLACLTLPAAGVMAQDDDLGGIPGLGGTRLDVPRPSSGAPACALALGTRETVARRVARLRSIGLFADQATLTDDELGARIERALVAEWGDGLTPDDPFLELLVAEQDRSRVWWRDLEADVSSEADAYHTTIGEWAAISLGVFAPTDIEEHWASDTGPISVTFLLDGVPRTLEPGYLEDWLDARILDPINGLIEASGRRFRMVTPFDQTAYVLALTEVEQAALERVGWCFS